MNTRSAHAGMLPVGSLIHDAAQLIGELCEVRCELVGGSSLHHPVRQTERNLLSTTSRPPHQEPHNGADSNR
jgi:hypothetical protein